MLQAANTDLTPITFDIFNLKLIMVSVKTYYFLYKLSAVKVS